jgi:hypothetical protein
MRPSDKQRGKKMENITTLVQVPLSKDELQILVSVLYQTAIDIERTASPKDLASWNAHEEISILQSKLDRSRKALSKV